MKVRRNQLPITAADLNHIAQVYGQDTSGDVERMKHYYATTGGMNPLAAELARDRDGRLNEAEVIAMLGNFTVWAPEFE